MSWPRYGGLVCLLLSIFGCGLLHPDLDDLGGIAATWKNSPQWGNIYIVTVSFKYRVAHGYKVGDSDEKFYDMIKRGIDELGLMKSYCPDGYEIIRHIYHYEGGGLSGAVRCNEEGQ